jgi:hypothetical protein
LQLRSSGNIHDFFLIDLLKRSHSLRTSLVEIEAVGIGGQLKFGVLQFVQVDLIIYRSYAPSLRDVRPRVDTLLYCFQISLVVSAGSAVGSALPFMGLSLGYSIFTTVMAAMVTVAIARMTAVMAVIVAVMASVMIVIVPTMAVVVIAMMAVVVTVVMMAVMIVVIVEVVMEHECER